MSIRLRLTVWYSALLAFTLFLFGLSIYTYVDFNIYGDVETRISKQIGQLKVFQIFDWENLQLDLNIQQSKGVHNEELFIQIVDFNSGKIKMSDNLRTLGIQLPAPVTVEHIQAGFYKTELQSLQFLICEQPIQLQDNKTVGVLQVITCTEREAKFMRELRNIFVMASMVTVVLAFSLGLFLAQKSLHPIENIIKATDRIQKGADLSVRIPRVGSSDDEVDQLTDRINSMLGRMETFYNELDEAYRKQRRFVSDASHELRTPLTTIRGNVDLLDKIWLQKESSAPLTADDRQQISLEALSDIANEAKRMSRLVNDMLSLARADAGYVMEKSDIKLKTLIEEVVRRAQFLPRKAEWIVGNIIAIENSIIQGNKDYLQQMLFIFIENAFKYTEKGYVRFDAMVQNQQVGLQIEDTGIGMKQQEIPYIFDRFYRADISRGVTSGTGLGLSIAKWIIDEHYGSIEVVTTPSGGSTFIIWLPLSLSEKNK